MRPPDGAKAIALVLALLLPCNPSIAMESRPSLRGKVEATTVQVDFELGTERAEELRALVLSGEPLVDVVWIVELRKRVAIWFDRPEQVSTVGMRLRLSSPPDKFSLIRRLNGETTDELSDLDAETAVGILSGFKLPLFDSSRLSADSGYDLTLKAVVTTSAGRYVRTSVIARTRM